MIILLLKSFSLKSLETNVDLFIIILVTMLDEVKKKKKKKKVHSQSVLGRNWLLVIRIM